VWRFGVVQAAACLAYRERAGIVPPLP